MDLRGAVKLIVGLGGSEGRGNEKRGGCVPLSHSQNARPGGPTRAHASRTRPSSAPQSSPAHSC